MNGTPHGMGRATFDYGFSFVGRFEYGYVPNGKYAGKPLGIMYDPRGNHLMDIMKPNTLLNISILIYISSHSKGSTRKESHNLWIKLTKLHLLTLILSLHLDWKIRSPI